MHWQIHLVFGVVKRYSTLFAVRISPATLTKVLRGNPNRVTLDIGFSNAAAGVKSLMEINASAKALGPASGLKSSSWAGCLE
jgi:hypothetical protein